MENLDGKVKGLRDVSLHNRMVRLNNNLISNGFLCRDGKQFSFFPSEWVQQDELRLNAFLVLFCFFKIMRLLGNKRGVLCC